MYSGILKCVGETNTVSGYYSVIMGGKDNCNYSNRSFIGGGQSNCNIAGSDFSVIRGGVENKILTSSPGLSPSRDPAILAPVKLHKQDKPD